MEKIREKLGNLESAYVRLEQLETLLNILANNYFNINKVSLEEKEKIIALVWEYKTYQDILFVGMDILHNQLSFLKDNLYGIYDDLRGKQDEKI